MPRDRRAQYLGASLMNASAVGLISNLQTGNIRPRFHLVFGEYFETVHAIEDQEPPVWSGLNTFQSFKSAYDDEYYFPNLAY